jgi:hypothetical protein
VIEEITPELLAVSWQNSSSEYPIEVLVSHGSALPNAWSSENHRAAPLLSPGSTWIEVDELVEVNTTLIVGVRYVDGFGGASVVTIAGPHTTGAVVPAAPRAAGIAVIQEY